MHGISEQQWIDYLDRRLDAGESARVEAHLDTCAECRAFQARMARTSLSLREAGARVRGSFPVEAEQTHNALAHVLARVLDAEARQQKLSRPEIEERLEQLEEMLAEMCGSWTAANALRLASRNAIHDSVDNLTRENWPTFLKRLASIASVFCGDSGAKLVLEYGSL
jgi:anti-sigma factor RsiW